MKETMLLYHISGQARLKKIRTICTSLHIRPRLVKREEYLRPIFQLLSGQPTAGEQAYRGAELPGEMLVMAVLRENIDAVLEKLRKEGIQIPLKAVVTPDNGWWSSLELYEELQREHRAVNP